MLDRLGTDGGVRTLLVLASNIAVSAPNRDSVVRRLDSLDFLAAAACLAPVTTTLGVFSTIHVTYKFHPLHIAKMGATIDFVSRGRWGLNVVTGSSNRRENLMFGQQPFEHDMAYEVADEFMTLMKWLWASDEPIDFATTSCMPSVSNTARIGPPAMMPVPGGAARRKTLPAP